LPWADWIKALRAASAESPKIDRALPFKPGGN
jgi:hypothetical protein